MEPVAVIASIDHHGEGPLWNVDDGRLWWTDIHGQRVRRYDPTTGAIDAIAVPERLCAFAFIEGERERILAAFATGIGVFDLRDGSIDWIARPEIDTGRRFNDGRVDRAGRFWVGSMVEDARAAPRSAALWRVDGDRGSAIQQDRVQISNGLCSSLDGRTLYFADSPTRRIDAYDLDPATGRLANRRTFATIAQGEPDGATVDTEDCMWIALWGAGQVARYSPAGELLQVVSLPVSQPSCVSFGGDDLATMYVTTSRLGMSAEQLTLEPQAGSIFAFKPGAAGVAESRFRPA